MAFAEGYIDVATRITEFRAKYPEGSLRPANPDEPYRILVVDNVTYLVVVAAAFRTADDQAPGIGMAQEQIPGKTPFTKGSELQNAETSAWGRAIVAVGAADMREGVASANEVRNRRAEQTVTRTSDLPWIEDFGNRLTAVTSKDGLRALRAEAQAVYEDFRLTDADVSLLDQAMKSRADELTVVTV